MRRNILFSEQIKNVAKYHYKILGHIKNIHLYLHTYTYIHTYLHTAGTQTVLKNTSLVRLNW